MKLRMKAVGTATRMCLTSVLLLVKKIGGYPVKKGVGLTEGGKGLTCTVAPCCPPSGVLYCCSQRTTCIPSNTDSLPRSAVRLLPRWFVAWTKELWPPSIWPARTTQLRCCTCSMQCRANTQGPLTEELVFRSAIISVSILGGFSWKQIVFATPLWFGLGTPLYPVYLRPDNSPPPPRVSDVSRPGFDCSRSKDGSHGRQCVPDPFVTNNSSTAELHDLVLLDSGLPLHSYRCESSRCLD